MRRLFYACLTFAVMGILTAASARATCYGCDQSGACQIRDQGLAGFTSCNAYTQDGNYFCDLSGDPCTGGSGGGHPCRPSCNQGNLYRRTMPAQWALVGVHTWNPNHRTEWIISNVVVGRLTARS